MPKSHREELPSSKNMTFFKRSSFCVVTGASRGLGREIALQLAQKWSQEGVESDIVLVARTESDLKSTQSDIESTCPGISVHVITGDLQDLSSLHDLFSRCTSAVPSSSARGRDHQQFVLVHDAGSAGDITRPIIQQTDPILLHQQMGLNFTSMSVLTSLFLGHFTSGERVVVNVSSLLATVFLPGFAMYSSTRAARNALISVMAEENPDVRFLTYTPGPCKTAMFQSIVDSSCSQKVREMFQGQIDRGEVLTCRQSISKLIQLLKENRFKNAAVIDYYDEM